MVILNGGKHTYIQISKEVANKLNEKKIVPRESYEEVLRRLLKMEKRTMVHTPRLKECVEEQTNAKNEHN